mgnify:CR=1 FL=1
MSTLLRIFQFFLLLVLALLTALFVLVHLRNVVLQALLFL